MVDWVHMNPLDDATGAGYNIVHDVSLQTLGNSLQNSLICLPSYHMHRFVNSLCSGVTAWILSLCLSV